MENTNKKVWSDNILWILLVGTIILYSSEIIGALIIPEADMGKAYIYTLIAYLDFISIWVGVILTIYIFKKNHFIKSAITGKTSGNNLSNLAIGLLAGFLLNGFCALAAMLHGDFNLQFRLLEPLPVLGLLAAVFVQSSAEEVLCRGFIYQRLLKSSNSPFIAITLNSLFFAMLHLFNDGMSILAFYDLLISGVFFSMLLYYFDSLWMAMGAHTGWNFTQSILLGLPNSGQSFPYSVFGLGDGGVRGSFAYDTGFGLEGTVLSSALMTICCIVLYIWKRKKDSTEYTDNSMDIAVEL